MDRRPCLPRDFLAYWLVVIASYFVVGLLRAHGSIRVLWEWVWPRRLL
ncbi:MAG TPA: hypothetical protein VFZ25_16425 [Chloroflexota bacterium]|nr:hypothetical protein [Chloroflexota bacterium]